MRDILVLVSQTLCKQRCGPSVKCGSAAVIPDHPVSGLTGPCSRHNVSQQLEQQI